MIVIRVLSSTGILAPLNNSLGVFEHRYSATAEGYLFGCFPVEIYCHKTKNEIRHPGRKQR